MYVEESAKGEKLLLFFENADLRLATILAYLPALARDRTPHVWHGVMMDNRTITIRLTRVR